MLVLTRKWNESVMIGDDIEVVVAEIRGDRVRLGFNAPPEVKIYRTEVYEEITASDTTKRNLIAGNNASRQWCNSNHEETVTV